MVEAVILVRLVVDFKMKILALARGEYNKVMCLNSANILFVELDENT
jgi:hypothetical protein